MLLVDNSVLKMYQLKSQLTLQIKSVAFVFVLFFYLFGIFWGFLVFVSFVMCLVFIVACVS
jgi:hypothetical protein